MRANKQVITVIGRAAKRPRKKTSAVRAGSIALGCAALAVACNSDDDDGDTTPAPTAVLVDPTRFLGGLPCSDAEGAVRLYQATLLDVTDGWDGAFPLPSGDVLSCSATTFFGWVAPGHRYAARVEAFDRAGLSAFEAGVPLVVDEDGVAVAPRWTTTCWGEDGISFGGASSFEPGGGGLGGSSAGGAGALGLGIEAFENTSVTVGGCDRLARAGEPGATGISFRLDSSLFGLECGSDAGQVERFSVVTNEDESPDEAGGAGGDGGTAGTPPNAGSPEAACDEEIRLLDREPGQLLTFPLHAFEAGASAPTWTATCRAYTVAGVIVPAECSSLVPVTP